MAREIENDLTYLSVLKDSPSLFMSTYSWCSIEETPKEREGEVSFFPLWMWATCLDKNRTVELWNSIFLSAHLSLVKVYLCILTLDLVTSSLPWGHRIYKWIRTLNRISPCTQAATSKEISVDDLWPYLVWICLSCKALRVYTDRDYCNRY